MLGHDAREQTRTVLEKVRQLLGEHVAQVRLGRIVLEQREPP